jgi:hypothetical protein
MPTKSAIELNEDICHSNDRCLTVVKNVTMRPSTFGGPTVTPRREFWAQESSELTDEFINSPKVDAYLLRLRKSHLKSDKRFFPRELRHNEIPKGLESMWTEGVAPSGPRKIVRAFDDQGFYHSEQPPLSKRLPDLFVTQQFRAFIDRNHERLTTVLTD